MYLWTTRTEEVPDEETVEQLAPSSAEEPSATESTTLDDGEAVIEEVSEAPETPLEEVGKLKMKSVVVEEWTQANPQPPLWMRLVSLPVSHHSS